MQIKDLHNDDFRPNLAEFSAIVGMGQISDLWSEFSDFCRNGTNFRSLIGTKLDFVESCRVSGSLILITRPLADTCRVFAFGEKIEPNFGSKFLSSRTESEFYFAKGENSTKCLIFVNFTKIKLFRKKVKFFMLKNFNTQSLTFFKIEKVNLSHRL